MRVLVIFRVFTDYWKWFYARHPSLAEMSYAEQKAALDRDAFGQMAVWEEVLPPLGYEVLAITPHIHPKQMAWARERGLNVTAVNWMPKIALEQAKAFQPDIVYDIDNLKFPTGWRQELREACPSIRAMLGYYCAPIQHEVEFQGYDAMITCVKEWAERFRAMGFPCYLMSHCFNPRVLERIDLNAEPDIDVSFVGGIIRRDSYHLERERMLEQVAGALPLQIFTSQGDLSAFRDGLETALKRGAYRTARLLERLGVRGSRLHSLPFIGRAAGWTGPPMRQINPRLLPYVKPPVYGLAMYQTLRRSRCTLNAHIDIAAQWAGNIRLYEATGVGTCLVTDWKPNLSTLFEPDREVIAYRSAEECVEKVRWLLDHPRERREIAERGQQRTLSAHVPAQRAAALDEAFREALQQTGR